MINYIQKSNFIYMNYTIPPYDYPENGILFMPEGLDNTEDLFDLKLITPEDPALGEAITKNIYELDENAGISVPQVLLGDVSLCDGVRGAHCPSTGTLLQGSPKISIHPDDNHYDPNTHTLELSIESAAIILHETNHAKHRFCHDGDFEHVTLKNCLGTAEQDLIRGRLSANPVMRKAAEMETFFLSICDAKKYNMKPETLEMIFQVNLENLTNYDYSIVQENVPSKNWLSEEEFNNMRPDEPVRETLKRLSEQMKENEADEEYVPLSGDGADTTVSSLSKPDEEITDDDWDFLK